MITSGNVLIDLLGAVALLLWGLRMVREGATRALGASLRQWIGIGTRNRFAAFGAGLVTTLILQSSTATSLLTASFAGRGLMTTGMGIAVMLGADVGTTLVAQVLTLDVRWLSPLLILAGALLFASGEHTRRRAIARAILGLGLMLLALQLLSAAVAPLRASEVTRDVFQALEGQPLSALVLAAVVTAVSHSSLAVVLLVASLASSGVIGLPLAAALVLGANLGGTVPPLLATAPLGPAARRVPAGNAFIRLVGCAASLPLIGAAMPYLALAGEEPTRQVMNLHTAFNLALAVLFIGLVGPLGRLAARLLPEAPPEADPRRPRHLDEAVLGTPSIALAAAMRETMRVGDVVETMLRNTLEVLRTDDSRLMSETSRLDDVVDSLSEAVKLYLTRLNDADLDPDESRRSAEIMSFAINLEHIGDIIDKSLLDSAAAKIDHRLRFSEEGYSDIAELHARTMENLRMALSVLISGDLRLARRLVAEKDAIRDFERAAAESHLDRVRRGLAQSIETSALHLDILRDLKRINAHLTSISYPILDQAGELRESRLRTASSGNAGRPSAG